MTSTEWYQQSLTPPEVFEVNVRIGIIPSTDHMQVLVEIKDPMSQVLIGQASRPHAPLRAYQECIEWALERARSMFEEFVAPF